MKISRLPQFRPVAALSCATVAFAQNPCAGTWKIDYAKSHITGDTIPFTPQANGEVHIGSDNYALLRQNRRQRHDQSRGRYGTLDQS